MTQQEINLQREEVKKSLKGNGTLSRSKQWDFWNYVLNILRQNQGKALVDRKCNPYKTVENGGKK